MIYSSFPEPIRQTDTVFLGDSLTESFDLQKHFGRKDFINRGISGDLTDHVIYRLEEITNSRPASVFLMIGINDISQGYAQDKITANISKILHEFKGNSPDTRLSVQSILPINSHRLFIGKSVNTEIYRINLMLKSLCESYQVQFIDLHADFLNTEGEMDEKFTYDGVHLTETGYMLWAELLRKYITQN